MQCELTPYPHEVRPGVEVHKIVACQECFELATDNDRIERAINDAADVEIMGRALKTITAFTSCENGHVNKRLLERLIMSAEEALSETKWAHDQEK